MEDLLVSHRGHDAGALVLARQLSRALTCPLEFSTTTRLLVDLNRSIGHRKQFSDTTRGLPLEERALILERHYHPYRDRVEDLVREGIAQGDTVAHVSCHSFTPTWKGEVRKADIGLLYDPKRPFEAARCAAWRRRLQERDPSLNIRRNDPYRGDGDGLTTHLRTLFAPHQYLGIELEVNQKFVFANASRASRLRQDLIHSLRSAWALSSAPTQGERQ